MKTILPLIAIAISIVSATAMPAQTEVLRYGVSKNAIYFQDSPLVPVFYSYYFEAFAIPSSSGALLEGTVQGSHGAVVLPMTDEGVFYNYPFHASGDLLLNQGELDLLYANGPYEFFLEGVSANYSAQLSLTGDIYPAAAPRVTNSMWSQGRLLLDAGAASEVAFTSFEGMALLNGHDAIVMTIEGAFQDGSDYKEYITRTLANSFTIEPNLMIQGNVYSATLGFLKLVDGYESADPQSPIPGAEGLAFYGFRTNFEVMAIPEPSTYALMAVGAGILAIGAWRRRASRRQCRE
jgi:hypothetical protein